MKTLALISLYLLSGQIDPSVLREDDSETTDYSAELPRIPGTAPEDALATFELIPGYRIDQVAAEPLVTDPVAMAFDEYGRLFVAEMRGYSELRDQDMGLIRLLEDTDGDGTYDKSSVYAEGLAWPTAVICYGGGIFVGAAPDILYIKDTDGDGVADEQEVVFTGFGLKNVQGLLNSFRWSVDNRIHGATSSSGGNVRRPEQPESEAVSLNGRDFSFDPRTLELRPESGGAQHGMSFDRWGNKFVCSNSDHIQQVLYEDRYAARNPYLAAPPARASIAEDGPAAEVFRLSPVEPWRIVRTRLRVGGMVKGPIEGGGRAAGYFTGATGVTIYKGDAMPELLDMAFIGDVGGNLVHRKQIDRSTFPFKASRVDEGTEFLRSNDIWFRPAQFDNGPDGALYVADMCREVIEHPASLPPMIKKHLDLNSGNDRGRIYRIVPEDFQQPVIPRLGDLSSEELVPYLDHANAWHRETAARLLYERKYFDEGTIERFTKLLEQGSSVEGLIVITHAMAGIAIPTELAIDAEKRLADEGWSALSNALSKRIPEDVPEYWVQWARASTVAIDSSRDLLFNINHQTFDESEHSPQMNFEVLMAEMRETIPELSYKNIVDFPDDPWIRFAVRTDPPGNEYHYFLFFLLKFSGTHSSEIDSSILEWARAVADRAGRHGDREQIAMILALLDKDSPEDKVSFQENGEPYAFLPEKLIEYSLAGLKTGLEASGHADLVNEVLERDGSSKELYERFQNASWSTATDSSLEISERISAISSLTRFESHLPQIDHLLDNLEPPEIQLAVIERLRDYGKDVGDEILLSRFNSLAPRVRNAALDALTVVGPWALALLDAIDDGSLPRTTIDSVRADVLKNHADKAVRTRAEKVLRENATPNAEETAAKLAAILALAPDPKRGETVFAENCTPCHKVGDLGYTLGPDLATVAEGGREKIIANILDPNAEINPQYLNYIVETKDWESYSGVIISETASSVTLQRAHGATDQILRHDIESIKSTGRTIMPEDWDETLGEQAIADVAAYLSALGG